MLKHITELNIANLPEVNGCHFVTKFIGSDREAYLIIGKTAKTIKCIRLHGSCVEGGDFSDYQVYEYFYEEEDFNDKTAQKRFYSLKAMRDMYSDHGLYCKVSKEPSSHYDPTF